jgi:hypothetical protein
MPLPAPQELRTYFTTPSPPTADDSSKSKPPQISSLKPSPTTETKIATNSLEKAMQFIKGGFSFRLRRKLDMWSRSFNQTQILTSEKFETCKTYIEQNPIRAGLVSSSDIYDHSSATRTDIIDSRPPHLR